MVLFSVQVDGSRWQKAQEFTKTWLIIIPKAMEVESFDHLGVLKMGDPLTHYEFQY